MRVLSYDLLREPPERPELLGTPLRRMGLGAPGDPAVERQLWTMLEHQFSAYGASRHFVAVGDDGGPLGHLSVFLNRRLGPPGEVAIFGAVELPRQGADEVLDALLPEAEEWCRRAGAKRLRGPQVYSTWYPNRFILTEKTRSTFPGDSPYPVWMGELFAARGFEVAYGYFSAVTEPLERFNRRIAPALQFAERHGFRLERVAPAGMPALFRESHDVSLQAFSANYSYTPIDLEEFSRVFGPAAGLEGALAITARDGQGTMAGVVFGYAAPGFEVPGAPGARTAVLKSIATYPGLTRTMIGASLSADFHRACAERGYTHVIHALMAREKYASGETSEAIESFREYGMFERPIPPAAP